MEYLIVKWLHILSSTFLFGTGIGSAFYMLFTSLSRDVRAIAVVSRYVVLADWIFTSSTVVLQPLTGFYLVHLLVNRAVPAGGGVLAAGGVDPAAHAQHGAGRRTRRHRASGTILALPAHLVPAGHPRLPRAGGGVLPDGGQADVGATMYDIEYFQ
jgi:hypothetical protein